MHLVDPHVFGEFFSKLKLFQPSFNECYELMFSFFIDRC